MSDKPKCNCDLSGIPPEQLAKQVQEREPDVRTAYMDGTDFLYELGADGQNHVVGSTPESVQEYEGHSMDKCGIAEVEVRFIKWIKEPK